MIEHTTSGTDEEIDTSGELTGLVLDGDTSVDSEDLVLVIVLLDAGELIGDLESELTGWGQDYGLDAAGAQELVLTEIFDYWQAESECFSGAGEISSDDVLTVVDRVETMLLNGKEVLDPASLQLLDSLYGYLWIV